MKRIVECEDAGVCDSLLGKRVTYFCMNYIYEGKLIAIDGDIHQLEDAHVVYETGELDATEFKDAQPVGDRLWHVRLSAVESFGETDK